MTKENILIKCLQHKVNSNLQITELNKYSIKELTNDDLYLVFEYTNTDEIRDEFFIFFKLTLTGTDTKIKYCFAIVSFLKENYVSEFIKYFPLISTSIIETSEDYITILDVFINYYNYKLDTHKLSIHKDIIKFYTIYNNDSKL